MWRAARCGAAQGVTVVSVSPWRVAGKPERLARKDSHLGTDCRRLMAFGWLLYATWPAVALPGGYRGVQFACRRSQEDWH